MINEESNSDGIVMAHSKTARGFFPLNGIDKVKRCIPIEGPAGHREENPKTRSPKLVNHTLL